MYDEDQDFSSFSCPTCKRDPTRLGYLGNRTHWRCRNCGIDFSHETDHPMKLNLMQHNMKELSEKFPGQKILPDPDTDEPYVSARHGDWEGRYHNGPYVELHHVKHGPQDVINVSNYKFGYPELHAMVIKHAEGPDANEYIRYA